MIQPASQLLSVSPSASGLRYATYAGRLPINAEASVIASNPSRVDLSESLEARCAHLTAFQASRKPIHNHITCLMGFGSGYVSGLCL